MEDAKDEEEEDEALVSGFMLVLWIFNGIG